MPYVLNREDKTATWVPDRTSGEGVPADAEVFGTMTGCCLYGGVEATTFDREIGKEILTDGLRWIIEGGFRPEYVASRYRIAFRDGEFHHPPLHPKDDVRMMIPYSPDNALRGHLLRAWAMGCQNNSLEAVAAVERALELDQGEGTLNRIDAVAETLGDAARSFIDEMLADRGQRPTRLPGNIASEIHSGLEIRP